MSNNKLHWENVYENKSPNEVSWTQKVPQTSIDFIQNFELPKDAKIIDVGGGDSNLVDHLVDLGYSDITVLDISEKALQRAKARLGPKAAKVTFIVSDIVDFEPHENYDIWHDRATFHFLTDENDIKKYYRIISNHAKNIVIGTFSNSGPLKCSGLTITQYSQATMETKFSNDFEPIEFKEEVHTTPFETEQNFLFGVFKKR